MSAINTTAPSLAGARLLDSTTETLGRSLGRLAASLSTAPAVDPDATTGTTNARGAQTRQAQAALAGIQTGISYVQAAGSSLDRVAAILTQMGGLSSQGRPAGAEPTDRPALERDFSALQQQLRGIIGGTTAEIGGATAAADPASFDGVPLFGGAAPAVPLAAGGMNLRTGPVGALIRQSPRGAFTLSATSNATADAIAGAQHQVAARQAALGDAGAQLATTAATLQVEASNFGAALAPLDTGGAGQATAAAQADILGQPLRALLAHANQAPGPVLKLLAS